MQTRLPNDMPDSIRTHNAAGTLEATTLTSGGAGQPLLGKYPWAGEILGQVNILILRQTWEYFETDRGSSDRARRESVHQ